MTAYKITRSNHPRIMRFYPFVFTGKERDEETGYGYFGARYMDHELMTMWLSVDPMADKYPSISPYAYCVWNPVQLIDPDGNMPFPSKKELLFAIKHPIIAMNVGYVSHGSSNISTCAVRFATRGEILYGANVKKDIEQGSEAGAFRHAVWQATITAKYGANIAKEIGDPRKES